MAIEGCLRALGSLIALPFLPLVFAIRLVVGLFTLIRRLATGTIGLVVRLVVGLFSLLVRLVTITARLAAAAIILAVSEAIGLFAFLARLATLGFRHIMGDLIGGAPALRRGIGVGASEVGNWLSVGASESAKRFGPAKGVATDLVSRLGKGAFAAITFAVEWVLSIRDDFQCEGERYVNPVSLVAKLLFVAAFCSISIILLINLVLLVLVPRA